jgi:hypothetical protein
LGREGEVLGGLESGFDGLKEGDGEVVGVVDVGEVGGEA